MAIATVVDSIVHGLSQGSVIISYTLNNSCGSTTSAYQVSVTSTTACDSNSMFSIYPNPTTGPLTIHLPNASTHVTIKIIDMSGRIINEIRPADNQQTIPISLVEYAKAMYLLRIETQEKPYIEKIVRW